MKEIYTIEDATGILTTRHTNDGSMMEGLARSISTKRVGEVRLIKNGVLLMTYNVPVGG